MLDVMYCQLSLLPSVEQEMSTSPKCGDARSWRVKTGMVHSTYG